MAKTLRLGDAVPSVIVLPDMHIRKTTPGNSFGLDEKAWSAVLSYIEDCAMAASLDHVIQLGDLMDFDQISSYNAKNAVAQTESSIMEDFEVANRVLGELEASAGGAKITIIEGNHDERIRRYAQAHPQNRGAFDLPKNLRFDEREITWVPYSSTGKTLAIGKALFGHGIYTGAHHAKQHVDAYGANFFYGHLHDIQSYSRVTLGDGSTQIAQSLGCLCKYNPYYLQGRPNKWQQAFAQFWFQPNGRFNYSVISIFNGRFVAPNGKLYCG